MVIQNGKLEERIEGGAGMEEFVNRIRRALGANAIPGVTPGGSRAGDAGAEVRGEDEEMQAQGQVQTTDASTVAESTPETTTTPGTTPVRNANVPIARTSQPATAPTPTREEPTQASPVPPPSSKAKGKQKATPSDPKPSSSTPSTAQSAAREALRKKKQEEKEELARIKARIEADKAERRAQAEARKAERERERETLASPSSNTAPVSGSVVCKDGVCEWVPGTTSKKTSTNRSQAKDVHLNVRLFDGRTVRHTFPRTANLQNDVRPWIDSEFAARAENPREKHPPYYFRQILAPLPSRELSAGEESETLGDIDLAPSATLVLIPVKGYTEAYSGGGGGIVGGVVGGVTGLVGGVFGMAYNAATSVGGALGSIVGYGGESAPAAGGQTTGEASSNAAASSPQRAETQSGTGSTIRVRTLADQRAGEPRSQELYNGNQVRDPPFRRRPNGCTVVPLVFRCGLSPQYFCTCLSFRSGLCHYNANT